MAATKSKVTIDPIIQKAMDEHGDCVALKVAGKPYVFRPLTLDEFESFQARGKKDNADLGALNREAAQTTLVHPSLEELQATFQSKPGLASLVGRALTDLTVSDIELAAKKG